MGTVAKYLSMVRFSHTIFAMPFALIVYVYALVSTGTPFDWVVLLKMLLCMVFARNTAMGFNRWADRAIDAANPRTARREIPAGKITPAAALGFVIINAALFILTAGLLNRVALAFAPVVLFILISYSYTKRYTAWCHLVLGVALGMAPLAAYVAVAGESFMIFFTPGFAVPVLLAGMVITWVTGFDIVYALQDLDFDRQNGLHSVPVRWGATGAIRISIVLHLFSLLFAALIGVVFAANWVYWLGFGIFSLLLIAEHVAHTPTPSGVTRIGNTFGLINGAASFGYTLCFIIWLLQGW